MQTIRAVLAALFVPSLAGGLVLYILNATAEREGASLSVIADLCLPDGFSLTLMPMCANVELHYQFLLVCVATAAAGIAVIIAFIVASVITGSNRILLSFVFPGLSFLGLVIVALIVVAQVGIIAGAAYFAEQFWFGQVHVAVLLIFAGIGALLGLAMLWRTLRMFHPAIAAVTCVPLPAVEQPRVALLVQQVARATGARPPDNIVVGLEPTFFATTAPVFTFTSDRLLLGQTLYLSLPLMRVLSLDEIKTVIGHELAHFSGRDTIFSRQFAPIYRGLAEAAHVADENKPYDKNPLLLPARLFLRFMLSCFHNNAAKASRARELRADEIGSKAATTNDLGYALIKSGILSMLWQKEFEDTLRDLSRGRFRRNMSRNFEDKLRFDVSPDKLPPLVELSLNAHTPHPTDSHPTTKERLERLGLNLIDLGSEQRIMERFFAARPARLAFDSMEHIEERLTHILYHQLLGPRAEVPVERTSDEIFVAHLTAFLAHMVVADGVIDSREIDVAEHEAMERMPGFDQREFRDFCRAVDQLPPLGKLTEWAVIQLTPAGFEALLDMLEKIARADGELHEREVSILTAMRAVYEELLAAQSTDGQAG
jgi:Zn-dependent protease with chaperone function/uncharacterized tellurite resistance protein B-like protein